MATRNLPVCVLIPSLDGKSFLPANRMFWSHLHASDPTSPIFLEHGASKFAVQLSDPIGMHLYPAQIDQLLMKSTSFILGYIASSRASFNTLLRYCAIIYQKREGPYGGLLLSLGSDDSSDHPAPTEIEHRRGIDLSRKYGCNFFHVPASVLHTRKAPWDELMASLLENVRLMLEYKATEIWWPPSTNDVTLIISSLAGWLSRSPLRKFSGAFPDKLLPIVRVFLPSMQTVSTAELRWPCTFVDVVKLLVKSLGHVPLLDEFFLDDRKLKAAIPGIGEDDDLEEVISHIEYLLLIWPGPPISLHVLTFKLPQFLSIAAVEHFESFCAPYNAKHGHPQTVASHILRLLIWVADYHSFSVSQEARKPAVIYRQKEYNDPVFDAKMVLQEKILCIKVLLLGHGAAGKTSLVKALRKSLQRAAPAVNRREEATIGVETHTLTDGSLEFVVWDFAGQLEYMSTHQHFFSTSCTLYVVVVDVSKPLDLQREHLERWLGALQAKLGNLSDKSSVRVMVVGNKIDLPQDRFDSQIASGPLLATIERWRLPYPAPAKRVSFVSCLKETGIKHLQQQISEEAKEMIKYSKAQVSDQELSSAVDRLSAQLDTADVISLVLMPESAAFELFPGAQLSALSDRGLIAWYQTAHLVSLKPSLLSQIVAVFVSPSEHRRRLLGILSDVHDFGAREPLISTEAALQLLRGLPYLSNIGDDRLVELLKGLEAIAICYYVKKSDSAYGISGFLYPSLLPSCEIFHLPWLVDDKHDGNSLRSLACQYRILRAVGNAADYFSKLLVRTHDFHNPRYRLFANCILLRRDLNVGLVCLTEIKSESFVRIIIRGPTPTSLLKELLERTNLPELPYELLCGVCAQGMRFEQVAIKDKHSGTLQCAAHHVSPADGVAPVNRRQRHTYLWSPREGRYFVRACDWRSRGEHLRYCELRENETIKEKVIEWNRVKQMFYRFVGIDKQHDFTLTRVVFLRNDKLEHKFMEFYERMLDQGMLHSAGGTNADVQAMFDAEDLPTDLRWRNWVLRHLQRYIERVSGNDRLNLIAGWHGSSPDALWKVAEDNFLEPHELDRKLQEMGKKSTDPGYFGKGIYLTQYPSYGASYTSALNNSESEGCLLLSWVLMGRAYPVIEAPQIEPNARTLLGKGCKEGFHSHYAVVKRNGPTYLPCHVTQQPDYDEVVVFNSAQVLPRYLVFYKRSNIAPKTALPSLTNEAQDGGGGRFEQIDRATHSHRATTIVWVSGNDLDVKSAAELSADKSELNRQILMFSSSEELKVWLRTHHGCFEKKSRELRLITNRTRESDGRESAGEALISWVRSSDVRLWRKMKCLVYCTRVDRVSHLREAHMTFVSADPATLRAFCSGVLNMNMLSGAGNQ